MTGRGRDVTWGEKISAGTKAAMARPEAKKRHLDAVHARYANGGRGSFLGRHHTEEAKRLISENDGRAEKIAAAKKGWWTDGRVGKTVEELYGKNVGERLRKTKSERMMGEKNPAYGKVYEKSGYKSAKIGRYKGRLFRSLWEYSYYKHLESRGIDLSQVDHEPFAIPYRLRGRQRTYTPDFLVRPLDLLVEIKNVYALEKAERGRDMIEAKREAGEAYCATHGLKYVIVTERDFRVLSSVVAYADPAVEWIRR